jgi:hypothetical protein
VSSSRPKVTDYSYALGFAATYCAVGYGLAWLVWKATGIPTDQPLFGLLIFTAFALGLERAKQP